MEFMKLVFFAYVGHIEAGTWIFCDSSKDVTSCKLSSDVGLFFASLPSATREQQQLTLV